MGTIIRKPKSSKLSDPTGNGEKTKRVIKQHGKTLAGMGMCEPKNQSREVK